MNDPISCPRRSFLGLGAWAGAALLGGWPQRASWAAEGPAAPLRVAFFTDIHARVEWETPRALAACADRINALRPDLVLCGGDLITDGFTSGVETVAPRWEAYFEELHRRIEAPVHAAIGNHDLVGVEPEDGSAPAADPRADFLQRLGLERTYRAVDTHGVHVVFLDPFEITGDERRYRGFIPPEQLAWLAADLAALPDGVPWILVCHMPLVSPFFQVTRTATAAAPDNRVVVNNREVLDACSHRPPLLVLQGHLHVNERVDAGGTTFITGGAVCGQWWRGPWHGTPEGFGLATLHPDHVDWTYHTFGWHARRPRDA